MIKRNVTVTAKPNGGDDVIYEVGSVEDAIKHKEMLVDRYNGIETVMPYDSLIVAEVEYDTREVDDPEDDTCASDVCGRTYLVGQDGGFVGQGDTAHMALTAPEGQAIGIIYNGGTPIDYSKMVPINVTSLASDDTSIVETAIAQVQGVSAAKFTAKAVGNATITVEFENGCGFSFTMEVSERGPQ